MRWLAFAVAVLAACGGPSSDDTPTDDVSVDTDGDGRPDDAPIDGPDGVACPNALRPAKSLVCAGSTPVCCLGGPLGVTPRCAATVADCGQDSRLACDGANDCAEGQACCVVEGSSGGKTTLVGRCKDGCSLIETQLCNGVGTCKGSKSCCQLEGDAWGECLPDCEGYGETGR